MWFTNVVIHFKKLNSFNRYLTLFTGFYSALDTIF